MNQSYFFCCVLLTLLLLNHSANSSVMTISSFGTFQYALGQACGPTVPINVSATFDLVDPVATFMFEALLDDFIIYGIDSNGYDEYRLTLILCSECPQWCMTPLGICISAPARSGCRFVRTKLPQASVNGVPSHIGFELLSVGRRTNKKKKTPKRWRQHILIKYRHVS